MRFKKPPRRNKYNAVKTLGYDSKLEQSVHAVLMQRERTGQIKDIKSQQTVVLQDGPQNVRITWRADFSFIHVVSNELYYCEAKGFEDATYKLKLKLYRKNPPAPLEIWKGTASRPYLHEVIRP